ncbi:TRAP transporter substrate-binding protein DctP [Pontibacterium sp. N1Y112]|uniref:TRAP transporter substrate-binding protein DctP n=1 Tax=Pontibacterium sinense TaxID=2781979 RepID=A0A8J7FI35_9GAMM|nr:TRAP transporter substrate-binding protein DctP [Pontibacterium sinense]MBE9398063.1 TRAP transporter substrate-binding protein DctP [Pontibacterium sinense]
MKKLIKAISLAAGVTATSLAASVPAYADTTIRIAGTHAPDQYASQVLDKIKDRLEQADVGLKVKVFPASQLGSGEQLLGDAIRGSIDIVHAYVYSHKDPVLELSSLPYLFTSYDQMAKAYKPGSVYFDTMEHRLDRMGLKLLGITGEGFIGVMASKKPENINTTEKKGMNIRVWSSPAAQSATQTMGYNTTTIDWGDAFAAIQQRVVDGMIGATPEATYATFKEAIKYYVPYNAFVESTSYYASEKSWNKKLNQEQRDLIKKVFAEEAAKFVDWSRQNDAKYLAELEKFGVEVLPVAEGDLNNIAEEVRDTTWPLMEERIGKDLMAKVRAELSQN